MPGIPPCSIVYYFKTPNDALRKKSASIPREIEIPTSKSLSIFPPRLSSQGYSPAHKGLHLILAIFLRTQHFP